MGDSFKAAGLVLTGGYSRRMGRDKALLPLAAKPLVLHTVERLSPVVEEVVLVGAPERYSHLGLPVLQDVESGRGPLAGLVTALTATEYDWNLVVACDLPYLETRFLRHLLEQATRSGAADAVVPQLAGLWQPLCAVYHRRTLPAFKAVLAGPQAKIALAFERIRVQAVTEDDFRRFAFDERILKNMNTQEDYEEAKRILEAKEAGGGIRRN